MGVAGFEPAPFHYYVLDLQSSAHPPSEQHPRRTGDVLRPEDVLDLNQLIKITYILILT